MKISPTPNDLPASPNRTLDLADEIENEEEEDELDAMDKEQEAPGREPELTRSGLDQLTAWDEPTDLEGRRLQTTALEDESELARELVEGGAELAETELRDIREVDESLEEAEVVAAESGKTRR